MMFRQGSTSIIKRQMKTSQPRFKRISAALSTEPQFGTRPLPSVKGGKGFDSSKENLYYETQLGKVRSACKLDQTTIVSQYFNSIRKDYDEMSKKSRRELDSMRLKRRDIDFLRQKNQVSIEKREEAHRLIAAHSKQAQQVKARFEEAGMQAKTLEHIIARMKRDQVHYKLAGRIREEQLHRVAKQTELLDKTLIHQEEKLHKLTQTLGQCKVHHQKNKQLRELKFADFSGRVGEAKYRERFLEQRRQRTYELQSIELNDTLDEKNIHMRQIILAHRVADSLLQSKVSGLLQQYADVQSAFHLVKLRTAIAEPQLLTAKFFSYEQTAETLLQTISENESKVAELSARREALLEKYRNATNETLMITDIRDHGKSCIQIGQQKQALLKETNDKKLLADQILSWTNRRLQEIHMEVPSKEVPFERKFQELCVSIKQHAKKYQNFQWSERKPQTTGVRLKKLVKESSAQELSLRMRETEQMNESNLIQQQFMQSSRQNIIKKAFSIKHLKVYPVNAHRGP